MAFIYTKTSDMGDASFLASNRQVFLLRKRYKLICMAIIKC